VRALTRRVLAEMDGTTVPEVEPPGSEPLPGAGRARSIALGADHGGFRMKQALAAYLEDGGLAVDDCGTFSADAVDYPDYAAAVARKVAAGASEVGIIIDGAGIGSCMAANKIRGVRAAMCYDVSSARNSREHNHANVLTLGAGLIGESLARQIVDAWLETPWGSGRHAERVAKIDALEAEPSGEDRAGG
jgi:ribose 5-phosphate isomerase B